jgi:cytochrome c-type biogenesis protein CcmH
LIVLRNYLFLLIFLLTLIAPLQAAPTAQGTPEGNLDQRVQRIAEELRCLVCQNQSLADSNADLAIDLKNQVREKLKHGASEKEVINFMTERYGDFVLYRPPLKATTMLLWFGPALLLIGGLIMLYRRLRARVAAVTDPELSADDRARAAALLEGKMDNGSDDKKSGGKARRR